MRTAHVHAPGLFRRRDSIPATRPTSTGTLGRRYCHLAPDATCAARRRSCARSRRMTAHIVSRWFCRSFIRIARRFTKPSLRRFAHLAERRHEDCMSSLPGALLTLSTRLRNRVQRRNRRLRQAEGRNRSADEPMDDRERPAACVCDQVGDYPCGPSKGCVGEFDRQRLGAYLRTLVLPEFQSRSRPPCQLWNLFFGLRRSIYLAWNHTKRAGSMPSDKCNRPI
jgi:hypothetical protein